MSDDLKRSQKHEEARSSLPAELLPFFDRLVDEYKFAGTIYYGTPFVSYAILADLVKAGWRPSGEPIGRWAKNGGNVAGGTDDE